MCGYYHQDERDDAVGYGCLLLSLFIAVIMLVIWLALADSATKAMDGSNAGANAVTIEMLEGEQNALSQS